MCRHLGLARAACATFYLVWLAGCTQVVSVRPLYTTAEAEHPLAESRIEGEWVMTDLDSAAPDDEVAQHWSISPEDIQQPGGHYTVRIRPTRPDKDAGDQAPSFEMRVIRIAEGLYFDAQYIPSEEAEKWVGPAYVPTHLLGRLWIERDFVRLSLIDSDWLTKQAPADFRNALVVHVKNAHVIVSPTDTLRDLLGRSGDAPFDDMSYLCRPGSNCGALAIEDMLRRSPDEDKTLTTASRFLMKRGDYARAASLRRRRVERHPDAWEPRVDLATSLLFTRDLAGARDAFSAAARLAPGDSSEAHMRSAEGMAWSYFLEATLARRGARQLWEKTLDTAPRDSLIALAARIELENLAASRQR